MDFLESIGWIAAGFIPTFVSLQIGYILGAKKSKANAQPIIAQTAK